MTLRTTVSRSQLHVQLGIFGPRIPIAQIVQAEVARPGIVTGWGIRFGLNGSITYSVPSTAHGYVQVMYRRGRKVRTVRIMSVDPGQLVRAIDVARTETRRHVRVATDAERGPELTVGNDDVEPTEKPARRG